MNNNILDLTYWDPETSALPTFESIANESDEKITSATKQTFGVIGKSGQSNGLEGRDVACPGMTWDERLTLANILLEIKQYEEKLQKERAEKQEQERVENQERLGKQFNLSRCEIQKNFGIHNSTFVNPLTLWKEFANNPQRTGSLTDEAEMILAYLVHHTIMKRTGAKEALLSFIEDNAFKKIFAESKKTYEKILLASCINIDIQTLEKFHKEHRSEKRWNFLLPFLEKYRNHIPHRILNEIQAFHASKNSTPSTLETILSQIKMHQIQDDKVWIELLKPPYTEMSLEASIVIMAKVDKKESVSKFYGEIIDILNQMLSQKSNEEREKILDIFLKYHDKIFNQFPDLLKDHQLLNQTMKFLDSYAINVGVSRSLHAAHRTILMKYLKPPTHNTDSVIQYALHELKKQTSFDEEDVKLLDLVYRSVHKKHQEFADTLLKLHKPSAAKMACLFLLKHLGDLQWNQREEKEKIHRQVIEILNKYEIQDIELWRDLLERDLDPSVHDHILKALTSFLSHDADSFRVMILSVNPSTFLKFLIDPLALKILRKNYEADKIGFDDFFDKLFTKAEKDLKTVKELPTDMATIIKTLFHFQFHFIKNHFLSHHAINSRTVENLLSVLMEGGLLCNKEFKQYLSLIDIERCERNPIFTKAINKYALKIKDLTQLSKLFRFLEKKGIAIDLASFVKKTDLSSEYVKFLIHWTSRPITKISQIPVNAIEDLCVAATRHGFYEDVFDLLIKMNEHNRSVNYENIADGFCEHIKRDFLPFIDDKCADLIKTTKNINQPGALQVGFRLLSACIDISDDDQVFYIENTFRSVIGCEITASTLHPIFDLILEYSVVYETEISPLDMAIKEVKFFTKHSHLFKDHNSYKEFGDKVIETMTKIIEKGVKNPGWIIPDEVWEVFLSLLTIAAAGDTPMDDSDFKNEWLEKLNQILSKMFENKQNVPDANIDKLYNLTVDSLNNFALENMCFKAAKKIDNLKIKLFNKFIEEWKQKKIGIHILFKRLDVLYANNNFPLSVWKDIMFKIEDRNDLLEFHTRLIRSCSALFLKNNYKKSFELHTAYLVYGNEMIKESSEAFCKFAPTLLASIDLVVLQHVQNTCTQESVDAWISYLTHILQLSAEYDESRSVVINDPNFMKALSSSIMNFYAHELYPDNDVYTKHIELLKTIAKRFVSNPKHRSSIELVEADHNIKITDT